MRVLSSYKVLVPVGRVLNLFLPTVNMATKVNFNSKHLAKGDPLPPFNGTLRVFNMRFCPFAQRTLLALLAKQIPFDNVNVNLMNKPEWLTSVSPFGTGKVPALEISEGVTIYESLITVEYLDEVYPERPLLPKDPYKKAVEKILVEATAPIQSIFIKTLKFPETVTEETVTAYQTALDFLQEQLKRQGTKFIGGDKPGFADYMNWPWFERLLPLSKSDKRVEISSNKYGLLLEYLDNMRKDPAVSQYLVPEDIMDKFVEGYKTGNINYDLIVEN